MKSDEKGFKNPCFGLEIIKRSCVLIELLFLALTFWPQHKNWNVQKKREKRQKQLLTFHVRDVFN